MNLSKVFKITVLSAAVLGAAVTLPLAYCDAGLNEIYAIFQCADRGYFGPVPAPFGPADASGVFWQIGFGNASINDGLDTRGVGISGKSTFSGNDSGLFTPDVLDAAGSFPAFAFPPGSVCLGSNNWANAGVDGCCDNPRPGTTFYYTNTLSGAGYYNAPYVADDNFLNPYEGSYYRDVFGAAYAGYLVLGLIQDYPTAFMLKTPGDEWFALAAVTNMDRGNNGDLTGPCTGLNPGTNPATCDLRPGYYALQDIANGSVNAMTGQPNVIDWQPAPRPRISCLADCSGATARQIQMDIGPVYWNHDGRSVPSNNPTMATVDITKPRDATRASGVGVVDLLKKWGGLIRYTVQEAVAVDDGTGHVNYGALVFANSPGLTNLSHPLDVNGDPAGPLSLNLTAAVDTCYRVVVNVGKAPETTPSLAACRLGKCGDVGYTIAPVSSAASVACVGGALVSENIASSAVEHARGIYTVRWTTSAELSVQGFDIFAVNKRGERKVESVSCSECTTSLPGTYSVTISKGNLRGGGVESFRIQMKGGNSDSVTVEVPKGRAVGGR